MNVVFLNMSQFSIQYIYIYSFIFEGNWEEFSESFPILDYSGNDLLRVFMVQ